MTVQYNKIVNSMYVGLVMLLIDISSSMVNLIAKDENGSNITKIQALHEALQFLYDELTIKSRGRTGEGNEILKDIFHLFGFTFGKGGVQELFSGKKYVTPKELKDYPPQNLSCGGGTPMYQASKQLFEKLSTLLKSGTYNKSFPPVVFVMSDGQPNDRCGGNPLDYFNKIKKTKVKDGNTLVISAFFDPALISGGLPTKEDPQWPAGAQLMFKAASEVPDPVPQAFADYFAETQIGGRYLDIKPGQKLFFPVGDIESLAAVIALVGSTAG